MGLTNEEKCQRFKRLKEILQEYGIEITAADYDSLKVENKPARSTLRRSTGIKDWQLLKETIMDIGEDFEVVIENVRIAKQRQKFMDTNRVERKSFRNFARVENAVEELNSEILKVLNKHNLSQYTIVHRQNKSSDAVGILQLSDTHFNELVEMSHNRYDFPIAAKRCKWYVDQAKKYFKAFGVTNVLVAITGDILNSDRRLDEMLNEATNRSKAMFLAVQIIEQMLLDLNKDFNIIVACVTGNESRIQKDIAWTDILVTDNYDFSIFNILNYVFKGNEGIKFLHGNYAEQVINFGGKNILLVHGEQIADKAEQSVQKIKGKYASRGIIIDFVLCAHWHSCRTGDWYSRSSSMVGSNAYSDIGLQLASRASQNVHILHDNMIDSVKIDLQITDIENVAEYGIEKELESYNAKSASKTKKKTEILKIVV